MKRIFKFLFKTLLWFFALTILWVLVYKYVNIPATPLMAIRYYEKDSTKEIKHTWKPISEISIELQLAVICAEDQNFIKHNGFDVPAIKKAYQKNKEGKTVRGASTISQQTAKNVFLWPQRSWLRKGLETYFTFLIEVFWTKERILEVYLNSIEMGEGVYGAEAASNYWFNKSAKNLNKNEAAALASILPNPINYRANPPSTYVKSKKKWILLQMSNYGKLNLKPEKNK